jgi:dihydroneopterin aldolase
MNSYPLSTVGALIVAADQEVLLVRSHKWKELYSLPGGKVNQGETLTQAVVREIEEETQLKIVNIRFAIVQESIYASEFYRANHFIMHDFIADLASTHSKQDVMLNDEAFAFEWVSIKKALTLPLQKQCRFLIEWYIEEQKEEKKHQVIFGTMGVVHHQVSCIVGIYPEERKKEQPLWIDLQVKCDLSLCAISTRLEDSINYVALADICTKLALKKDYFLLETFAFDILEECMLHFPILWAKVCIKKPQAILTANYAYVEIERERE